MAESITILMRDGLKKEFREKGRPGGSYTIRVKYQPGFVIVIDEWDHETAIPTDLIAQVDVQERNRW